MIKGLLFSQAFFRTASMQFESMPVHPILILTNKLCSACLAATKDDR
ncbi:hypothetical protein Xsto_00636 [Xenorhabdus stockiae]|uniref:Uncharacterized protein n=1 Tax=Xenorhabdus stockiae TaxID=351614 RepID=A0A2D0KU93_9GAMM|nr:hypothetical protein Xsto_00636 [Xenorhabdus stockiae]PHM72829.1 hypothetical protein Xekj_00031 [Xenorhabdus sp. KJ12.1]